MTTHIGGLIHRPHPPAFTSKSSHSTPKNHSLPIKDRLVFIESQSHPVIAWIKMALGLIKDGHVEKWQAKQAKKTTRK